MIHYWDTSALIPCFLNEEATGKVREWLQSEGDTPRFTSWLTAFEFETVLKRKLQQKHITLREYQSIQEQWVDFQKNRASSGENGSRGGIKVELELKSSINKAQMINFFKN